MAPFDMERAANTRRRMNHGSRTNEPVRSDSEVIGIAGELAFALRILNQGTHIPQTRRRTPGYQFKWQAWTIKVQTSRTPGHLFVKQGKVNARIYVLAELKKGSHPYDVRWMGWATQEEVMAAPVGPASERPDYPTDCHGIPAENLRPMLDLCQIIGARGPDAIEYLKALEKVPDERDGESDTSGVQGRLFEQ